MTFPSDPRAVLVPHESWYPYQRKAIEWIGDSRKRFSLVEGHVGVGKTAVAAAQAYYWDKITAATATHSLADQYNRPYGFTLIKGRDNYPCDIQEDRSCEHCLYTPMSECPNLMYCQYHRAKIDGLMAGKTVTNYHYLWWSRSLHKREQLLVCDEAHLLESVVLSIVGMELKEEHRKRFSLPPFPPIMRAVVEEGTVYYPGLMKWVEAAMGILKGQAREPKKGEAVTPQQRAAWYRLRDVRELRNALESGEEWFVNSGNQVFREFDGKWAPGLICKPLEPGRFAGKMFDGFDKVLLLSATLGDAAVVAETLGIDRDEWDSNSFSDPQFVENNPVRMLPCPKMTAKAGVSEYERQADVIAGAVKELPKDYRGLILTTSWSRVGELAKRLGKRGLGDRLYVPDRGRTNEQVTGWLRDRREGCIAVAPVFSWGHGLDLTPDKANFSVLAKTPWADWGDAYTKARATRKGGKVWYDAQAAVYGAQALFRVRSGVRMIADGSWGRVHKYAPKWMRVEG